MVMIIENSEENTNTEFVGVPQSTDEYLETDVQVKLKWFNQPKGFGFVVPVHKDVDAFLHITTLQIAQVQTIGEGAILICDIGYGAKGAMVRAVKQVIDPGLMPGENNEELIRKSGFNGMEGTVKWYKPDKGFGFVIPDDGQKDIFVHKTCLEKHGVEALIPGQRIKMAVKDVPKGREAVTIEVIGAQEGGIAPGHVVPLVHSNTNTTNIVN